MRRPKDLSGLDEGVRRLAAMKLRVLLIAAVAVAAFFGALLQKRIEKPASVENWEPVSFS